ncbi:hypothetical protein D3C72_2022260 [compost metagenome]
MRTQIVRHRWTVGFVIFKQFIAERFALRVKNDRCMRWLILKDQTAQHVQHTVHRAGRQPCAIGQRRKRMIRPIKVRRAIDENKRVFWDLNHSVRAFN